VKQIGVEKDESPFFKLLMSLIFFLYAETENKEMKNEFNGLMRKYFK
jgi:hypothetical protein